MKYFYCGVLVFCVLFCWAISLRMHHHEDCETKVQNLIKTKRDLEYRLDCLKTQTPQDKVRIIEIQGEIDNIDVNLKKIQKDLEGFILCTDFLSGN